MKKIKYVKLSIGLTDKDTRRQEIKTEDAFNLIANQFLKNKIDASFTEGKGIYTYDDGFPGLEKTIFCTILFYEFNEKIQEICNFLKIALNQESIAIEEGFINSMLY